MIWELALTLYAFVIFFDVVRLRFTGCLLAGSGKGVSGGDAPPPRV